MSNKIVFSGVGHGGNDGGASANGLKESDINLVMAQACHDVLVSHGVPNPMSRYKDENDPLQEEIRKANASGASIAIDFHNNAGGGDGFEAYHSIGDEKGKRLAMCIEKYVVALGQNSRGVKTKVGAGGKDYFGFIRETTMTAIIVESFFLDSIDRFIADTVEEQRAFGVAIAKGILEYLGIAYNGESSKPNPIPPPPSNELYRVRKSWEDASSQKGAYSVLDNAKKNCPNGYSVFDSKGNIVYSNGGTQPSQPEPTPPPSKRKVDSFIKVDAYSWVTNLNDYAGVFGIPVKNFYAYPSKGEILFRVSPVNKDYYPWVQNYKTSTGYYDFAGNGVPIDRVQMKLRGLYGYRIKYRVHLLNGDWLPWVYDDIDYAGIRGKVIDAIEVEIV